LVLAKTARFDGRERQNMSPPPPPSPPEINSGQARGGSKGIGKKIDFKRLKIRDFFRGRGRVKIQTGAYIRVCEDLNFNPNEEIGKKINF
jgi:hypothetical protein